MICSDETEDCFGGNCGHCPNDNLIDILTNENEIDLDDNCSWTLWKKVNNKFDLQRVVGSVDSLLTEIEERWSDLYYNRQQRDYIKEI